MLSLPLWAKILGPIAALAILLGSFMAWSAHKYRVGYNAGVSATDKKWEDAAALLKKDAAQSATKADDAAVKRLEEHVAQANEDQAKVDAAVRNGSSPLDAIFGGGQ